MLQAPHPIAMMGGVQRRPQAYPDSYRASASRVTVAPRCETSDCSEPDLRRALADVAARFASASGESIDSAVEDTLREVAILVRADRAFVSWQPGPSSAVTTFEWAQPSLPSGEASMLAEIRAATTELRSDQPIWFTGITRGGDPTDADDLPPDALQTAAVVPIGPADDMSGAVAFGSATERLWLLSTIEQLRIFAGILGQALARRDAAARLQTAHAEVRHWRSMAGDVIERPSRIFLTGSRQIVSDSAVVRSALQQVEQVAKTPATVLLLGETGVGKEVFAQVIHELSARGQRQMIKVSCAAIPSTLIESELFGHERGAFTGASTRQIGRFEAANHSTLFLDEIGELSAEVQVKLLRVLQERVIERLGSTQPVKIDVRIIAATNRNLEKAVEDRLFREDLYYRLNVFPLAIPPLRERVDDIPRLAWQFVDECARALGKTIDSISKDSMRQLQAYQWPGNVRELRNVIERAVIVATGPRLVVQMPEPSAARHPQQALTLRSLEIEHIRATLESTNWRIRGHGGAAQRLGLKPTTLETRMAKLGVIRPRPN
jgi:formate hydrogenlyase transcriptional activator